MYDEDLIEDSLALVKELRERMGDKKTERSAEVPKMVLPKAELPKPVDLSTLTAGNQTVPAKDLKQDEEERRKKEALAAAAKEDAMRRSSEVQAAREIAAAKAREEAKLRAQEEARLAAEKARREEQARLEAEKARREEQARLAAEKARREEQARLAAEKARREEQARLAAEKARREEQARLAAEKARREEQARLAAEKARREEQARLAAEKARREEQARLAAEKARREEQARLAAEKARKKEVLEQERARLEEEKKKLEEQIAAKKAEEEARKKVEAEKKVREEARKAEEEEKKIREEARKAEEAEKKAGDEARRTAETRKQDGTLDDADPEEAVALEAESIRALPDDKSYEVTIHLDFTAIRNFLVRLIDKLKPEERTLEDVNEAMEENRRLLAEEGEVKAVVDPEEVSTPKRLLHKSKRLAKSVKRSVQKKIDEAAFGKEDKSVDVEKESAVTEGEHTVTDTEEEEFHLPKISEETKEKVKKVGQTSNRVITNVIIVLICVAIAYFAAAFLTNFVMYETTVDGESMEMALDDGDSLLVQKISYYFKDPQRYDVIVFSMRDSYTSTEDHENKKYLVKRVIGLPGETVQIMDGCVYINGEKLEDDHYGSDIPIEQAGIASDPQTLGENQYFVLGDNREVSEDSREFGIINKSNIEGKAFLRIWPFRHLGSVK